MDKELFKNLIRSEFNKKESQILNYFIVSLISADTLINVKACESSLEILMELKEAMQELKFLKTEKIKKQEYYLKMIDDGISICKRDLETFQSEEKR